MEVTSEKKFHKAIKSGHLKDAEAYIVSRELKGLKDNEMTGKLVAKLCIAYCKKEEYNQAKELLCDASARNKPAITLAIFDFSAEVYRHVFNKA